MDISFDAAKNARNIARRGISFEQALKFEWASALIVADTRRDYGESRFQAFGRIAAAARLGIHAAIWKNAHYQST